MGELNQAKCDLIEQYMTQYGWNFNRGSEMGKWNMMIRSDVALHELFITIGEWWILFVINPFVIGPKDPAMQFKLYKHLLLLNPDYCGMKYSLSTSGDVIFSVELPYDTPELFQYEEFTQAIDVVFYHCNNHYPQIIQLATDPNATSSYLQPNTDVDIT